MSVWEAVKMNADAVATGPIMIFLIQSLLRVTCETVDDIFVGQGVHQHPPSSAHTTHHQQRLSVQVRHDFVKNFWWKLRKFLHFVSDFLSQRLSSILLNSASRLKFSVESPVK